MVALPDTHPLASARRLSISRLTDARFVTLPSHEGAVLNDRLAWRRDDQNPALRAVLREALALKDVDDA